MIKVTINAELSWSARPTIDGNRWIVSCDPLGIDLEANNRDEIAGLIEESLDLLFLDLLEDNELEQFLSDRGWSMDQSVSGGDGGVDFDVPWQLAISNDHDSERMHH